MADEAKVEKLADGLYLRQAVDNITWADMGEYSVAVDALEQAHLANQVLAAMRRTVGDKPVRFVLNTHMHYDHVALHADFRRRGAQVVCQARGLPADREGYIRFDRSWRLAGDGRTAEMHAVGPCHTPEDAVVFFPEDGVLCVGDIFGWGLIPVEPYRASARGATLATYRRLIDFGAPTIVPGHGPVATVDHLRRWVAYFEDLEARVNALKAEGRSDAEVHGALPPPEDMRTWWRFTDWKHEHNIDEILHAR